MVDDREETRAILTLTACQAMVDQEFTCLHQTGEEFELQLVSAKKIIVRGVSAEDQDRPFSLVFRGPLWFPLPQGIHDLAHHEHPLTRIFLVPVAGVEGHAWYEAVFS